MQPAARICGPTALTARSRMSSTFRTRWRRASPASSSRRCRPPKIARTASRPTDDLTAYDLYLRGYAMVWSSARHNREALGLMEQAIARDPRYGPALAWAAFCCLRLLAAGRSEDRHAHRRKGADFARRAL